MRVFRDKLTGRFAKASTWERSKAHGGSRYVRQTIKAAPPGKGLPEPRTIKTLEEYGELYGEEIEYEDTEIETGIDSR
jgi:hypothetical protein